MTQELPLSGALFVTTPQDLAQMDAERTVALLRERKVPVIGLIQNMAWLTCPHCQGQVDMFAHSTRLADDDPVRASYEAAALAPIGPLDAQRVQALG